MPHFLDVPVPYTAHVVPPQHRNEQFRHFLTSVLVEVPEVATELAPVALRATLPDIEQTVYRVHKGALLRPLTFSIDGRRFGCHAG